MKILILGGSGHVSGAVAKAALEGNNDVWAVTRGNRPMDERIRSLVADRHDFGALEKAVTGENVIWDLVVDCICFDRADMVQDIKLFSQCAKQFVFISSDFVFDPLKRHFPQPAEGDYCSEEVNSYGWNKRCCEEELINGDSGDMAWTILRPCHIYGPTSELGCLPLHGRDRNLIETLQAGKSLDLVDEGHFLQQPLFVDDLAKTILSVAGNSRAHRKIFNMAGPDVIESREYYRIVAEILGVELMVKEISTAQYREKNPHHLSFLCHRIYDLSPLRDAGLSAPSTPIAQGLRLHVEGLMARRNMT